MVPRRSVAPRVVRPRPGTRPRGGPLTAETARTTLALCVGLPAPPTPLIGREHELAAVRGVVLGGRTCAW